MKAGIFYADAVTTVSPTYAREIQGSRLGCGMDGVLRHRADRLTGILNGIDTREWDPESDQRIAARYSPAEMSGKNRCRASLLKQLGMDRNSKDLVVGMLGRMAAQKGWQLMLEAAPALLETGTRLVLMGSGHPEYEQKIGRLAARYPDRLGYLKGFDEDFAHQLVAGADAMAIPSIFEPCGLVQMYAQRYGTVPIAHRIGGLVDTVVDVSDRGASPPTGFLFDTPSALELTRAVGRAAELRTSEPVAWERLRANGMARDFSWNWSARYYAEVYQTALDIRRAGA
jgi:starch synthase